MAINKLYNFALENLVLPFGDVIEGGAFMRKLRQYRREQWLSTDQLQQLQHNRLSEILQFARAKVPFYKNLPKFLINPFEDIKQFPVLHKQQINENVDLLTILPKETLIASSGSGSSGVQGTVYLDKSAQASHRAMQMLWFEWSGYRAGDGILQTGMTLNRGFVKGMKDRLLRTTYIPAFTLNEKSIAEILGEIENNPPEYLFGYASSLYVLAKTASELKIKNIKFKYAVSWGDKLFPHYRTAIRQAFNCETLDTYGCTEGAMIGAECPQGKFHLCINQCYIEVVDDDYQPVPKGHIGKVLATRLDNFAMPLIRYYLGDLVELNAEAEEICACGRGFPLLKRVIGRDTDIVRTSSGKYLIVHFFTAIFEHLPQVRQFQVVQKNLDEIEIHYIPSDSFNPEILPKIENQINDHLREKLKVRWIQNDFIAPTKSGKPQIIQSLLTRNFTEKS